MSSDHLWRKIEREISQNSFIKMRCFDRFTANVERKVSNVLSVTRCIEIETLSPNDCADNVPA